ncbi:hypothetical protein PR048_031261 [Dryococelus australis]|uniref:Uncharacterized protein n=1 Tax=Dryococelus australis TaxID=614101 RepID=A0ABQ9G4R4_9NEOP|nr:hypothetical protein PR048_031261 [Dryococelus australis]
MVCNTGVLRENPPDDNGRNVFHVGIFGRDSPFPNSIRESNPDRGGGVVVKTARLPPAARTWRVIDGKTARQHSALRIETMGELMRISRSPLAPPRKLLELRRAKFLQPGGHLKWLGDPRENPTTSGVVQRDSHMRISGIDPAGNRIQSA